MSEYAKGFDAGVDVVLLEIERWIKERGWEPRIARPVEQLLAHLRMETTRVGKTPRK
jgi:hypothetical protein